MTKKYLIYRNVYFKEEFLVCKTKLDNYNTKYITINKDLKFFDKDIIIADSNYLNLNQYINLYTNLIFLYENVELFFKDLNYIGFCASTFEITQNKINFKNLDKNGISYGVIESSLVKNLVEFIPDKNCDVMWCQVTQPLFDEFDKLISVYNTLGSQYDSICVVKNFNHHLINENGDPVNFNFGYWHKLTQDLPKLYQIAWADFIMKREFLNQAYYQIGRKPYLFKTNKQLIDIDTEEDFKLAQIIYRGFKYE